MNKSEKMERKFHPVSIALLTVSDTRVFENDKSGNLLAKKFMIVVMFFLIEK